MKLPRIVVVLCVPAVTSLIPHLRLYPVIEQRKRDRLMAYALAHLLGDYLVPMTHPDHQKPAYILSMPLSYPQVWLIL